MFYYAELNEITHVCTHVHAIDEEYSGTYYIQITEEQYTSRSVIGQKWDFDTLSWVQASETDTCNIAARQVSLNTRRLDLFIGDETGLSVGDATIDNLVDAVNACFQRASNGKDAIANAITGVDSNIEIPDGATFAQLAALIGQLGGLQVATGTMAEFTTPNSITGATPFQPKLVVIYNVGSGTTNVNVGLYVSSSLIGSQISDSFYGLDGTLKRYANPFSITSNGFSFSNHGAATNLKWLALG